MVYTHGRVWPMQKNASWSTADYLILRAVLLDSFISIVILCQISYILGGIVRAEKFTDVSVPANLKVALVSFFLGGGAWLIWSFAARHLLQGLQLCLIQWLW